MTTTQTLIDISRQHLLAGAREPQNKLAATTAPGTTSLLFSFDMTGIVPGSVVQIDLELFYVWAVDATSKTATVQPAWDGTVATAHDAGTLVAVNPRFPNAQILRALNDDLLDLSAPSNGLYAMRNVRLAWNSTAPGGYDLTGVVSTSELSITEVRAQRGGSSSRDWPLVTNWTVSRDVDSTVFPSGLALFLDASDVQSGAAVRVRYRSAFGQLTTLSDDVTAVTGLPATAHDIPPLGAAARLLRVREGRRNFTESQGDSRRAAEVPQGAVRRSGDFLWQDRQRRIAAEQSRLAQQNPAQGYVPPKSSYVVPSYSGFGGY